MCLEEKGCHNVPGVSKYRNNVEHNSQFYKKHIDMSGSVLMDILQDE
jgi:hypothetical protein